MILGVTIPPRSKLEVQIYTKNGITLWDKCKVSERGFTTLSWGNLPKSSFQFLSGNFHFNPTFCYKFGMLSTWDHRISDGYGMSTTVYLFSASTLGLGSSWCSSTANAQAQQSTVWAVSPRAWRHTDVFCWEWNKTDVEWWLEGASETPQECQVQRQTLRVVWELESPASMPWNR